MTFTCFVCKEEAEGGYHVFMKARKPQEKDNFRDVCEGCMTTLLVAGEGGYVVLDEPRIIIEAEVSIEVPVMPADELVELFREAMNILPTKVRRGMYSPFWDKCQETLALLPRG